MGRYPAIGNLGSFAILSEGTSNLVKKNGILMIYYIREMFLEKIQSIILIDL